MLTLTADELNVTETALFAYKIETEGYLSSYRSHVAGHDECCPTARAITARRHEEWVSLDGRLTAINAALGVVHAALEMHEHKEKES